VLDRRRAIKTFLFGSTVWALRPGFALALPSAPDSFEVATVAGFKGRGGDDTARLSAAFSWLQSAPNRSLTLDRRRYVVSACIPLVGARAFRIKGNGATIAAADGMPVESEYQILNFQECSDGEIADLNVDGNRSHRSPAEVPAHSVQIFTGCARLRFLRVQSDNAVVDGFYVDTHKPRMLSALPTDIEFRDCRARNAFRNNVSVINSNRFREINGIYNGANGTPPMAGIDFEPNGPNDLGNIDVQCYGTRCDNNKGAGFQVTGRNTSAALHDVAASANGDGAVIGQWGYLRIDGITVENYGSSIRRGIIDAYYMSGETHISRVRARNCNPGSNSKPIIFVHPTNTGPVTIDDVATIYSTHAVVGGNPKARVSGLRLEASSLR
jgi:hypothetical protein